MNVRKMGVEEELLLVEPESGMSRTVSHLAVATHEERTRHESRRPDADGTSDGSTAELEQELFLQQLETGTAPCPAADELERDLVVCRRAALASASAVGAALVASGTPVLPLDQDEVTPKHRYRRIVEEYGEIGRQGSVCGMHVHVDVADDEEGVRVLDGLRPWLPVLRAISVNSPYVDGRDTGYASWRTQMWGRWPTAGPADPFGDPVTYRQAMDALVGSGAALDAGMLYFDARLSQRYPTVEIRVFDAVTEVDDVLLLALLSRALVTTVAEAATTKEPAWRVDALRAAHWRAARYGLASDLLDPLKRSRQPARSVVEGLVDFVHPALEATGDVEAVTDRLERLLARGTGATRQRAAAERGGLSEVVTDLRDRFAASCQ